MSQTTLKGSCLCGAVQYEVDGPIERMGNCHCSVCRKQHGAAFATYFLADLDRFRITSGEEALKSYASSPPVRRQFCGTCGSSLFFRMEGMGDWIGVAAGTLDDDPGIPPGGHIFVASKAPWYPITDDLPQFEEYPPNP